MNFKVFFLSDNNEKNTFSKFNYAFDKMIKSSNIQTIGDFIISASYRKEYESFVYEETLESSGGYNNIIIDNKKTLFSEGTFQEGAFTISNLISKDISKQAICIYFQKGISAYLYFPISKVNKSAKPIILFAQSIEELKEIVFDKYGIELIGISFIFGKIKFIQ